MRNVCYILIILLGSCGLQVPEGQGQPVHHQSFTDLLSKHVHGYRVDYKRLADDRELLEAYLTTLSEHPPADDWQEHDKLAYWINAYNAFTLKLIIDNYPVQSITDLHPTLHIPLLNTVWHKKFFNIGGEPTSLDHIEHSILRKQFTEPRIHFAINCASISCPPLRNEAYEGDIIDRQLDEQARRFINDRTYNRLSADRPEVSKIFTWFAGDFKRNGSLIDFLNQYSDIHISADADVHYLDYDWGLNDVD